MAKKKKSKDPSSRLKALQKLWKKTQPKKFGKQAPDGDYEVKIVSAVIEEAKSESKRLQVLWTLEIIEGDLAGRKITHRSGLEGSEDALAYFQGELETLELEIPDSLEDVGEVLQEAIGLELEITLATRNEFQNCSFNELLEESEESEEDEEEGEEEDDEEEDEGEDEEEDDDAYPTEEEIGKMKKPALLELIEEYELEVDPEDLTLKELRAEVIEASEFEDEEEEEEEE
jgi:hypothetical protein